MCRLSDLVLLYYVFMYLCLIFFFFFKQKTAYEMRISDWSSDVCSSDLVLGVEAGVLAGDVALVVVARGAGGERGEAQVEVGLQAGEVDVALGRFKLPRTHPEVDVGHAPADVAEAGPAAAAEAVGTGYVAPGEVERSAGVEQQPNRKTTGGENS